MNDTATRQTNDQDQHFTWTDPNLDAPKQYNGVNCYTVLTKEETHTIIVLSNKHPGNTEFKSLSDKLTKFGINNCATHHICNNITLFVNLPVH